MHTGRRLAATIVLLVPVVLATGGCAGPGATTQPASPAATTTAAGTAATDALAPIGAPAEVVTATVAPEATAGAEKVLDAGDGTTATASASNTPADVRDAYMKAYETKSFASVVSDACESYKTKFGTDTSDLENQLQGYTIVARATSEPTVNGTVATATIALELTSNGSTERPDILIKVTQEAGRWRFCGEGRA